MATNIDKALYQQPTGLEELAQGEDEIEIEIVDPEEVSIKIGDMEINIGEEEGEDFSANLADEVAESALATAVGTISSSFGIVMPSCCSNCILYWNPTCSAMCAVSAA